MENRYIIRLHSSKDFSTLSGKVVFILLPTDIEVSMQCFHLHGVLPRQVQRNVCRVGKGLDRWLRKLYTHCLDHPQIKVSSLYFVMDTGWELVSYNPILMISCVNRLADK